MASGNGKKYHVILALIIMSFCSVSYGQSPSSEFLYVGSPYFYSEIDAAGYSDWIYWGPSPRHDKTEQYHEVLSGEWGGAVYYEGVDTEPIDPNNLNLGQKAMWLTDIFILPTWETKSNCSIAISPDYWDNLNNPVTPNEDITTDRGRSTVANDTGQSVIIDGKIEIKIDSEVVDLGFSVDEGVGGSPGGTVQSG